MNNILELHWRMRQREAEEARRQMEIERKKRINALAWECVYWLGIGFGACVLVLSTTGAI